MGMKIKDYLKKYGSIWSTLSPLKEIFSIGLI